MKRHVFGLAVALCSLTAAQAGTLDFTYNFDDARTEWLGYDKAETYDVALFLGSPSFTGAAVTGLSVAVPEQGIANPVAWLSSELKLKRKNGRYLNAPDIAEATASVTDGVLSVSFAEPYVIPAEGVYVGYSFEVTELDASTSAPVSTAPGSDESGLFLHSSRTKTRWASLVDDTGRVSAMTVRLQGDFPASAAYLLPGEISAVVDRPFSATVTMVNGGTQPVTSIEYSYKAGDWSGVGTATLATALPGGICRSTALPLTFEGVPDVGSFPLELKVTKINGSISDCAPTQGTLEVFPFIPVNRPLVEEYTGLWCGYCPRGYMALELMRHTVGDLFIAAAYHSGDDMAFAGDTPNNPGSYPAGYLNRSISTTFSKPMEDWQNVRVGMPEGEVTATVKWTDETKSLLSATATARFIRDYAKADYRIQFILIADGLASPDWRQHNSFAGKGDEYPYMDNEFGRIFTEGKSYVTGLTFNDVALLSTDKEGFPSSVPAVIEAGREYSFSYTFDLGGVPEMLRDMASDKMRVIAVLLDAASGKVVNCNSSPYPDGSPFVGIGRHSSDPEAVETARYAPDGTRLYAPAPGLNMIRYSDGSVRKVMVL